MMKPAPESTFSHWYVPELELSRPEVSNMYADNIMVAADHPMTSIVIFKGALPLTGQTDLT
jgi:hypothetical protein